MKSKPSQQAHGSDAISPPPSGRAVGLRDIANDLNISVSLVSKVLSGRLGTSGANPLKIREIHRRARELNYRKNHLAESLRTGCQNTLGVYIHRHGTPGSGLIETALAGIASATEHTGQRLMIHFYENKAEFHAKSPLFHRGSVDGVIVVGIAHPELVNDLRGLSDDGLPVVTIHDRQIDAGIVNIGMEQSEVTRLATLHLLERGCARPAHFLVEGAPRSALVQDRYTGYRRALEEQNLPFDPARVIAVTDFSYEQGIWATEQLLASGIPFDGIVGQSDEHALAAINTLTRAGVSVPQQVRVIGTDDSPPCRLCFVPLSSVSQQFHQRGERAVAALAELMAGRPTASVNVPPQLYPRQSSA